MELSYEMLERLEQIAADTKKHFAYNKHTGMWSWVDRDERNNLEAYQDGFPTRFDALLDAVAPYIEDED